MTAVELDGELATKLAECLKGTNVEVVEADAAALPLESDRFSAATCFTMLHHVPSSGLQDQLLAEYSDRGGVLVGSDSIASPDLSEFHASDIYVPIDPETFPTRLEAAGFVDITVEISPEMTETFRFRKRSPAFALALWMAFPCPRQDSY